MPKHIGDNEAREFGKRLVALLDAAGQPRRGAGAYLHRKYKVATVTANAWLNGEYKPTTTKAKRIANDHGATFDALYWGDEQASTTKSSQISNDSIHEIRVALTLTAQALAGSIPGAGLALAEALEARKDLRGGEFVETLIDTLRAELSSPPSTPARPLAKQATGARKHP
jgi:hypothetical protein